MAIIQDPKDYDRQCPGQAYRISDPVCKTRQSRNFPTCANCPFHDEQAKPNRPGRHHNSRNLERGSEMDIIFKPHNVRGTYDQQLDDRKAWCIGYAAAQFLRGQLSGYDRTDSKLNTLAVGRDMRKSSETLCDALIQGAVSGGLNVVDLGMIDTPQIYFAVNYLNSCGGIQTTAGSSPPDCNGFKIVGKGGKPIAHDTGLSEIKRISLAVPYKSVSPQGSLSQADLGLLYKEFIRKRLRGPGHPTKIAVDASNGMAGKFWPVVFGDVDDIETIAIGFQQQDDTGTGKLQDAVKQNGADFGICFDNDADRITIVDENGKIIPADLLTALLAGRILGRSEGSTVVYDLRSSRVVAEEIRTAGGQGRRERVGPPFVKRIMAETNAVFGGSLSGRFYFRDNWFCDSALLAVVELLNLIAEEPEKTLSELIAPLKRYHCSGQLSYPCESGDGCIRKLADKYGDAEIDYLDGITVQYESWWFNLRKNSSTSPLELTLEAETGKLLKEKLAELQAILGQPAKE